MQAINGNRLIVDHPDRNDRIIGDGAARPTPEVRAIGNYGLPAEDVERNYD